MVSRRNESVLTTAVGDDEEELENEENPFSDDANLPPRRSIPDLPAQIQPESDASLEDGWSHRSSEPSSPPPEYSSEMASLSPSGDYSTFDLDIATVARRNSRPLPVPPA